MLILLKVIREKQENFFEINSGHASEFITKIENLLEDVQRNNRKKSSKDKQKELDDIKDKIEKGEINEAEKKIKKVEQSLKHEVKGATTAGLNSYSEKLQLRGEKQNDTVIDLKNLIRSRKSDRGEQEYLCVLSLQKPTDK
jgi:hypothetical protein